MAHLPTAQARTSARPHRNPRHEHGATTALGIPRPRVGRDAPAVELAGPGAAEVAEIAGAVPDPELPIITLANLGVLRAVEVAEEGQVTVTITPTYSGCPAIRVMRGDVVSALEAAGYPDVSVHTVLSRAWSSDDMTQAGHRALRDSGIAPPAYRAGDANETDRQDNDVHPEHTHVDSAPGAVAIECPHCGSHDTQQLSRFGSTSCKALLRCRSCGEPFDYFKVL